MTYSQSFQGCRTEERSGIYDFEHYPISIIVDGVQRVVAYGRNLVTFVATERHFFFTGLSESQAHGTSAQTVTSAGGVSYTVPFMSTVVDSSSGSKVFVTYQVQVSRYPVSPHLWNVEVVVTETDYYVNGTKITFQS